MYLRHRHKLKVGGRYSITSQEMLGHVRDITNHRACGRGSEVAVQLLTDTVETATREVSRRIRNKNVGNKDFDQIYDEVFLLLNMTSDRRGIKTKRMANILRLI